MLRGIIQIRQVLFLKLYLQINADLDVLKKACKEVFEDAQYDLPDLSRKVEEQRKLQMEKEEEVHKFSIKTLSFFVELQKQICSTLDKADDIVENSKIELLKELIQKRADFLK